MQINLYLVLIPLFIKPKGSYNAWDKGGKMMLASIVHGKHFHKYEINYVCDVCKIRNVSAFLSKMVGGTNLCLKASLSLGFPQILLTSDV